MCTDPCMLNVNAPKCAGIKAPMYHSLNEIPIRVKFYFELFTYSHYRSPTSIVQKKFEAERYVSVMKDSDVDIIELNSKLYQH